MADPAIDRAARVAWIALLLLAVARVALGFVPSMAGWALNVQRFLPSAWGWPLTLLPLLGCVPALARPCAKWLDSGRLDARPARIGIVVAAALVMLALPDRVWFTGDFIGRQFSLAAPGESLAWYSHAMTLDLAVHYRLARLVIDATGMDAWTFGRLLGAIEAAALAWIALRFARVLDLDGARGASAAAIVFWGGWLALFTGYNKAFSDLVLVVALFGAIGLEVLRRGRGITWLAVVAGLGLLVHRSALALLPALGLAWWTWARSRPGKGGARWVRAAWPLLIPAALLAFEAPNLGRILAHFDLTYFEPLGTQAGPRPAGETRALDLINMLVLLSPAALGAAAAAIALGWTWMRRPETVFLAAVTVPFAVLALVFYPNAGLIRYWDNFVGLGVGLSMLTAWLVAGVVMASERWRWLGVTVMLGVAAPTLAFLVHNAHFDLGLARARTYLSEPPARAPLLRATAHEFLGFRLLDVGQPAEAAAELARAAAILESPLALRQWAMAETMAGHLPEARSILERVVKRDPGNAAAWRDLGRAAAALQDSIGVVRSLEALVRLDPSDSTAARMLRAMTRPTAP